jgi:hypothetical protein
MLPKPPPLRPRPPRAGTVGRKQLLAGATTNRRQQELVLLRLVLVLRLVIRLVLVLPLHVTCQAWTATIRGHPSLCHPWCESWTKRT